MSKTIWTPSGDHEITPEPGDAGEAPGAREEMPSFDDLSPEDQERARAMAAQLAAAQKELVEAPVEVVVANHAMGCWELAALHLSQEPPNLDEARVAIDAVRGILDAVGPRLGEAAPTLTQALSQIQLAWVRATNDADTSS